MLKCSAFDVINLRFLREMKTIFCVILHQKLILNPKLTGCTFALLVSKIGNKA